jgi:hypothetical protein
MRLARSLPAVALIVFCDTFARADLPGQPPPTDVPDVVVEPPLVTPGPEPEDSILIHIDSPRRVDLQVKDPNYDDGYLTVCTSPCDRPVPAHMEYRVLATGQDRSGGNAGEFPPSDDFVLPANATHDVITVAPRSPLAFAGGISLIVTGIIAMASGLTWLVGDELLHSLSRSSASTTGTGSTDWEPVVAIFGGGAVMACGIVLKVKARTRVSQSVANGAAGLPWVRPATWREPQPEQRVIPHPSSVPVFQIVF